MNRKQIVFMWLGIVVFSMVALFRDSYYVSGSELILYLLIVVIASEFIYTFRNKRKDGIEKPLNLERGFRRLTLFLAILVGLFGWFMSSAVIGDEWTSKRRGYSYRKEIYDNIKLFWNIWDANGWEGGQKETLRQLLEKQTVTYTVDNKEFILTASEVIPGIKKEMLNLPSKQFDPDEYLKSKGKTTEELFGIEPNEKVIKRLDETVEGEWRLIPITLEDEAKISKEKALKIAENNIKFERWGNTSLTKVMCLSIIAGLPGGIIGFTVVWIIYFITKWLILGFRVDSDCSSN